MYLLDTSHLPEPAEAPQVEFLSVDDNGKCYWCTNSTLFGVCIGRVVKLSRDFRVELCVDRWKPFEKRTARFRSEAKAAYHLYEIYLNNLRKTTLG